MFESLSAKFAGAFSSLRSKGRLKGGDIEEITAEIHTALIDSDVSVEVANSFATKVFEKISAQLQELKKSVNPHTTILEIVNQELTAILGGNQRRLQFAKKPPTIILLMGLQGSGKTSFSAKLALNLKTSGNTPLLVAADLQRPNAVDQLKVVGDSVNVPVFAPFAGSGQGEALQVVKDSLKYAQDKLHNFVIIDTAGRLAVDEKLISELRQIKQLVNPTEIGRAHV